MFQTQINVIYNGIPLRYGVEYIDNIEYNSQDFKYTLIPKEGNEIGDTILVSDNFEEVTNLNRITNIWNEVGRDPLGNLVSQIPTKLSSSYTYDENSYKPVLSIADVIDTAVNVSSINLYFPYHSVETYTSNWMYAFSAYTYINGDKIILAEKLIDRRDALSYPGKKTMHNIDYKEYINIEFPDPWYIAYSDDWAAFREGVCGEVSGTNNTGSLLTIEIHPVAKSETLSNTWIKLDSFSGGMSSMILGDNKTHGITPYIEYEYPTTLNVRAKYDDETYYETDGLVKCIEETYFINRADATIYCIVNLIDKNNIYELYAKSLPLSSFVGNDSYFSFDIVGEGMLTLEAQKYEGWKDYHTGREFIASFSIKKGDDVVISWTSDTYPLTVDMFSKIISPEHETINLDNIDMTEYNISAVNKIEKKVIQIDTPNDFKNNLTKPVFLKSQEVDSIVIHPRVTESIAINLRQYKNYIDGFILNIAGVEFKEVARQSFNVIFKVVGKNLPSELEEGTYYITDYNGELITTGKYTIE